MSSKFMVIISMAFLTLFFFFALDIVSVQFSYSNLDSKGISIGYLISKDKRVDDDYIKTLETRYNVSIETDRNKVLQNGDMVEYKVIEYYLPIIMSKNKISLSIQRASIVGYFG